MINRRCVLAISMLGFAAIALSSTQATAQSSTRSVELHTLGLPLPAGGTKLIITPDAGGDLNNLGTIASVHWDPTTGARQCNLYTRVLESPVVGKDSIGFYNSADRALTFQVEVAGVKRTVTLSAKEVITIPATGGTAVNGKIGSGTVDTTTSLAPGAIYKIQAQADKWVFAKL